MDYDGTAVNTYEYDEYGNITAETEGINNPFKYAGEVQNMPNSLVYLRNRIYIPRLQRFLQEDPIRDGTNWYVYCNSNPMNFFDPTGLGINVIGTEEDVKIIVNTLRQITDDSLKYTEIEKGKYEITITQYNSGEYANGTRLIRRIAHNDAIVKIQRTTSGQSEYDGNNKLISFNNEYDASSWTYDRSDGHSYPSDRPSYIGLAHELIHADRDQRGVRIPLNQRQNYIFKVKRAKNSEEKSSRTENHRKEELATIGLYFHTDQDITENMIRNEHGLPMRGGYGRAEY